MVPTLAGQAPLRQRGPLPILRRTASYVAIYEAPRDERRVRLVATPDSVLRIGDCVRVVRALHDAWWDGEADVTLDFRAVSPATPGAADVLQIVAETVNRTGRTPTLLYRSMGPLQSAANELATRRGPTLVLVPTV